MNNRVIVDQIDPMKLVPGGTDTCISDLVKFSTTEVIALVGVTSDPGLKVGRWIEIEFAGRQIQFLPVASLDRAAAIKNKVRLPDSLKVACGLFRYRKLIPASTLQAHRIETGFILSFFKHERLIQFIHNDSMGLTGQNSDSIWKRFGNLYRVLERGVFKRADVVVLFNRTDSERVRKQFKNLTVAQTWFDPDIFVPSEIETKTGFVISVVGRLEEQKDPMLALESLPFVLDRVPNASMAFVGSGSLKSAVQIRAAELGIADHVTFVGPLTRAEVAKHMHLSRVLLLTSHYEGSPRVLVEANATGLPVVATEGGDPDCSLNGVSNGIRVAGRGPAEIGNAILTAAQFSRDLCAATAVSRSAPKAIQRLLSL